MKTTNMACTGHNGDALRGKLIWEERKRGREKGREEKRKGGRANDLSKSLATLTY